MSFKTLNVCSSTSMKHMKSHALMICVQHQLHTNLHTTLVMGKNFYNLSKTVKQIIKKSVFMVCLNSIVRNALIPRETRVGK